MTNRKGTHNDLQTLHVKGTNNDLQASHIKLRIEQHQPH